MGRTVGRSVEDTGEGSGEERGRNVENARKERGERQKGAWSTSGRAVGRSVEDTGELSKDPGEWSAQAPLRSARITPQHSPHTDHPQAGTRTPNIARAFVRLPP